MRGVVMADPIETEPLCDRWAAYFICQDLTGSCWCAHNGAGPCEAMLALVEEGLSAEDERARMANACDDAADED